MPYQDLIARVRELYGPVLALERILPREVRTRYRHRLTLALVVSVVVGLTCFGVGVSEPSTYIVALGFLTTVAHKVYAITLLVFAALFVLFVLEAFFRSYYFRSLQYVVEQPRSTGGVRVTYEVAVIVDGTKENDLVGGFLESDLGQEVLFRAGVREEQYRTFVAARVPTLVAHECMLERDNGVTLTSYLASLIKQDKTFSSWLESVQVPPPMALAAALWVERLEHRDQHLERWWSRDMLGRIPSIGRGWSYGETYELERFGQEATLHRGFAEAVAHTHVEQDEVERLEQVLVRAQQANALLVGADAQLRRERIIQLAHKILEGHVLPSLEGKRIFFLDLEAVASTYTEPGAFEQEARKLFDQALHTGNTILAIENMTGVQARVHMVGIDLFEFLTPYLASSGIQLIATADTPSYEKVLSRDMRVNQYFELVRMHDIDAEALIAMLGERALTIELSTGTALTYPVLVQAAAFAPRFFPDAVMPDKAFDLLEQAASHARAHGEHAVYVPDLESVVEGATGVPLGAVTSEERTVLMSLEAHLHERVVGQDTAVSAVARALRRARAGTDTGERPMGSFLFLGPTGVGKTETAKALAEALFGSENRMIRFDMSEFSGDHALDQLLGVRGGDPGRLTSALREHQYGVLLLDEFEKSNPVVHDLFLQVLDEGYCTDAEGKRISARNVLVIATSNAGSDVIWQWSGEGEEIAMRKKELINVLIERGVYRPELLNRFDDVVLFHPLSSEHALRVVRLELTRLVEHLKEQGIRFEITDEYVAAVAKAGYDPQFGGRPLRRFIKDHVEQVVADRLLAGTLMPGMSVTLSAADLKQSG